MENKDSLLPEGFGDFERFAEIIDLDADISIEEMKKRISKKYPPKKIFEIVDEDNYRKFLNGEDYDSFFIRY